MKRELLLKLLAWEKRYKETDDLDTMVELMQDLIDTGDIHDMPERYMDFASKLIDFGLCHRPTLRIVK